MAGLRIPDPPNAPLTDERTWRDWFAQFVKFAKTAAASVILPAGYLHGDGTTTTFTGVSTIPATDISGVLPMVHGGTGTSYVGTANQFLTVASYGPVVEYRTLTGGPGITITFSPGVATISGSGGVTSFNTRTGVVSLTTADVTTVLAGQALTGTLTYRGTADDPSSTAFGDGTLVSTVFGAFGNTAFGYTSLADCYTGTFNTAVGYASLQHCYTGDTNTAIGHQALRFITTGIGNVAIGNLAGETLPGGTSNTLSISNVSTSTPLISGVFDPLGSTAGSVLVTGTFDCTAGITQSLGDNTTKLATTAFVQAAIAGYSGTITTAALTGGGSQGSMTFTNGLLTSQVQAT